MKYLIYTLILLFILGIIPILVLILMEKSIVFTVFIGILAIVGVFKLLID